MEGSGEPIEVLYIFSIRTGLIDATGYSQERCYQEYRKEVCILLRRVIFRSCVHQAKDGAWEYYNYDDKEYAKQKYRGWTNRRYGHQQ